MNTVEKKVKDLQQGDIICTSGLGIEVTSILYGAYGNLYKISLAQSIYVRDKYGQGGAFITEIYNRADDVFTVIDNKNPQV